MKLNYAKFILLILGVTLTLAMSNNALAQNSCLHTPYNKVFTPPLTPFPGGNVVINPTFDDNGLAQWQLLPNANRVVLSSPGYNSSHCAQIISTNSNAGGDAFLSQVIMNLTPGQAYSLKARLRSNLATNNKILSVDVRIRFNYPNGNYTVLSKSFFPNSTWTEYTNNFTVPNTPNLLQTIVQVSVYRGQNNSIFVDNIELNAPSSNWGYVNTAIPVAPLGDLIEEFKGEQGTVLDPTRWLMVKKAWGNSYVANNNGVVPENLELVCGGGLRFHAHGDLYNGPIQGAENNLGNGKIRVGACIATKDYYASGLYEVVAKVIPGVVNAFWTFHYIEDQAYQNGGIKNSEIDWEVPSNNYNGAKNVINDCLVNTWGGLCNGVGLTTAGISHSESLGVADASQDFHKYTIEWHTGGNGIAPSIKWYFDDVLVKTELNPTYIPFRASRFWVGVWFGNTNWITGGNPAILQYDDRFMEVKSVKILPFYEPNDVYETETNPATGFVGPQFNPVFPCTNNNGQRVAQEPIETNSSASSTVELVSTRVYPVPAQQFVHIHSSGVSNDLFSAITLFDLSGRVVGHGNIVIQTDTQVTVELPSHLSNGSYLMRAVRVSGQVVKEKIQILK